MEKKKVKKIMPEEIVAPVSLDLKAKIQTIMDSKMPEEQKRAYLESLNVLRKEDESNKVPFSVYAKIKRIDGSLHKAMLAYPKALEVKTATVAQWEEIFKGF